MTDRELREIRGGKISMVFQNPLTALNPVFSVGEQIAMLLRVHLHMSRGAATKARIGIAGNGGYSRRPCQGLPVSIQRRYASARGHRSCIGM
jgi:ABC-type dipeptide/oligopeptide/nickel transport system ATPase component